MTTTNNQLDMTTTNNQLDMTNTNNQLDMTTTNNQLDMNTTNNQLDMNTTNNQLDTSDIIDNPILTDKDKKDMIEEIQYLQKKKYNRKVPKSLAKKQSVGHITISEYDNNHYIVYEDKHKNKKWKKYDLEKKNKSIS